MHSGNHALKTLVEALLFASPDPISDVAISDILASEGGDLESVRAAIGELSQEYSSSHRAQRIVQAGGGWRMLTNPELMGIVERLNPPRKLKPLTPAALETLAVIAYKQPITKSNIDSIRGVNSEGVFRTLLERGIIAPAGRSVEPGRPLLYVTTPEFLKVFMINSIDDLPRERDFPATAHSHKVE